MRSLDGGRPGDERGFIHRRILGGIESLGIPGVSSAAGTARKLFGEKRPSPRSLTARPTATSFAQKTAGQSAKFGGNGVPSGVAFAPGAEGACPPGFQIDFITGTCKPTTFTQEGACPRGTVWNAKLGACISPISPLGAQELVGQAVMGRYGAALVPGSKIIDRAVCLKGMQLGDDGLCYNKAQISNKQRMWPAGRKPLLTGGDMRAISIAARAGRRLDGATKRLRRMGMMKALPAARAKPKSKALVIKEAGPGGVTVQ